jgi:hypothetical protein
MREDAKCLAGNCRNIETVITRNGLLSRFLEAQHRL